MYIGVDTCSFRRNLVPGNARIKKSNGVGLPMPIYFSARQGARRHGAKATMNAMVRYFDAMAYWHTTARIGQRRSKGLCSLGKPVAEER